MVELIIGLTLVSLVAYWVSLTYSSTWCTIPLVDRLQLCLTPLPVVVGMIAALTGYLAAERATTVAEEHAITAQQVAERESVAEVRRTVASAVTAYTKFLVALDRAYVAAGIMHSSVAALFLAPTSPNLTAMLVDQQTLADRINLIDQALVGIALDPFARTCYTEKWRGLDLRTRAIESELGDSRDPVASTADDPLHVSGLFQLAAREIQTTLDTQVNSGAFSAAKTAVRDLDDDPRLDNRYINFVYLGNMVGYSDGVLIGTAALADMLTAIPNGMELRDCLMKYHSDTAALRAASESVSVEFASEAITPVLVRFVREMELAGFNYYLEDVPVVAEVNWQRTLESINTSRWSLAGVHIGRLAEDSSTLVSEYFTVTRGRDYMVVGVCDEPCSDLDVTLTSERGNVDTEAESADNRPNLRFTASLSGRLSVNIRMPRCLVSSCGYIVGLFEDSQELTQELGTEQPH